MPALTTEREMANRDEILTAAAKLYAAREYRDISLGDIAALTSLSRPSIYTYFNTKEEIFLGLLKREFGCWGESLAALDPAKVGTKAAFAEALAGLLEQHALMLRIMDSNLLELENNSSMEALVDFKRTYCSSDAALRASLERCLGLSGDQVERFIGSFYPFMRGVYPFSTATDKQLAAMEQAGCTYRQRTVYEIALPGIESLLGV